MTGNDVTHFRPQGAGALTTAKLKYGHDNQVENQRPLSSKPITKNTEKDCSQASEEQREGDGCRNVVRVFAKFRGEVWYGERDREEVVSVHGPGEESGEEEKPLHNLELGQGMTDVEHARSPLIVGSPSGVERSDEIWESHGEMRGGWRGGRRR